MFYFIKIAHFRYGMCYLNPLGKMNNHFFDFMLFKVCYSAKSIQQFCEKRIY